MLSPPLKARRTASARGMRGNYNAVVTLFKGCNQIAILLYSPSFVVSRGLLPPFTNWKGAPRGEKHAMRPSERSKRPLNCGSRRQRESVVRSPSLTLLPSLSPDSHCSPVRNRRQVFREGRCANAICYMQLKVGNRVEMLK